MPRSTRFSHHATGGRRRSPSRIGRADAGKKTATVRSRRGPPRRRVCRLCSRPRLKINWIPDATDAPWAPTLGRRGFGKILSDAVLAIPRLGMINVHASLLPRHRGAAPVHRAIIAGDSETGVTIMRVVKALDASPMLATVSRAIGRRTTLATRSNAIWRRTARRSWS